MSSKQSPQEYVRSRMTVDKNGCWMWGLRATWNGYGTARRGSYAKDNASVVAHRYSYIAFVGDPGDLVIDHLCGVKMCVNPEHLEAITQAENLLRAGGPRLRTNLKCAKCGRMKTAKNVLLRKRTDRPGVFSRACRHCTNAANRKQRERSEQR